MKRLLTLQETAERTSLSEKALRMRIFKRTFPFTKIGKRLFIEEAELEKFLKLSQNVTAEEAAARGEAA